MDENVLSVLESLIENCKDGEKGYQDAAAHAKRPELKQLFQEQSSQRGRFAGELQTELAKLGKTEKKDSGTVGGALQRAWLDTKVNLGGGDHTILESLERGEDSAKEAYNKALATSLPPQVDSIVRRQAASIFQTHDRMKSLRDQLAA
ncbi:MAG: PA2169 family four-helix-bundle protein [Acidobacteria bacterium]|jgi:uncharacterized protein (TIGR02284 family)|nr:PA2169 family four-helix-bundle protein [Acidobacteriota bacterium]